MSSKRQTQISNKPQPQMSRNVNFFLLGAFGFPKGCLHRLLKTHQEPFITSYLYRLHINGREANY